MKNKTEHLYLHIPFCKEICTYCDFYRTKVNNENLKKRYVEKIIKEIKEDQNKFKTIYIGGGTPNFLNDELLNNLLKSLKDKLQQNYEFTIECNPEFINENQVQIFINNNVNRISLGVQTLNETILKFLKRTHCNNDVYNALNLLFKNNLTNISLDFIYNLPLLKNKDIENSFKLIKDYKIKHISYYSLEIKKGSILNLQKYKIDENIEEEQLELIKKNFEDINYFRYEISNWAINKKYFSQHNLAYWDLKYWKSIGVSGYGYENDIYYQNLGNIDNWKKNEINWTKKELYQYILIMGLRKKEGINLKNKRNLNAYMFFKDKLNHDLIYIENNFLKAKNFDLLNNILLDII